MNFRISDYNKLLGFHAIFRQIQQMCQIDRVKSAIKILSAKKSHLFARKWTCYDKEYKGAPDLHCLMMKHDSVVTRDTCVTQPPITSPCLSCNLQHSSAALLAVFLEANVKTWTRLAARTTHGPPRSWLHPGCHHRNNAMQQRYAMIRAILVLCVIFLIICQDFPECSNHFMHVDPNWPNMYLRFKKTSKYLV